MAEIPLSKLVSVDLANDNIGSVNGLVQQDVE